MKKSKLYLIIGVIAILAFSLIIKNDVIRGKNEEASNTTLNNMSAEERKKVLFKAGELEAEIMKSDDGIILYKGNNIEVKKAEADKIEQIAELKGEDYPRKKAIDLIIKREALYYAALDAGYTVTEKEVYDMIKTNKNMFEKAGNRDEAAAYFDGMGVTADEYYDAQFDAYKKELITSKFIDDKEAEYFKKKYKSRKQQSSGGYSEFFDKEYERLCKELVKKENVKEVFD